MALISFFGLGAMGSEMAGRLARAGHAVAVHDLDGARRAAWTRRFAAADHAPTHADFVITCVTDDAALGRLLLGPTGLIAQLPAGGCLIDHTTAAPATARALAQAASACGVLALDAPISGGVSAAADGTLSVMVGGTSETVVRARPILAAYAGSVEHLGAAGAGQLAKLANQVAIAGIMRGIAEALALARAGGLDDAALLRALVSGSAHSTQLERLIASGHADGWRFERQVAWLAKDLHLALEAAGPLGAALPMTELAAGLLPAP
jgi:3-hydroxyisobutyrate dehydrogenase-like beta-hydroxyacid dehydrogenase